MTLYSYTVRYDDGSAPNPFSGMCTLAICKPAIRRHAVIGDWIVGFGSKNAPAGNLSNKLVYAMRVDEVMTLRDYDKSAHQAWPHRVPDIKSMDMARRLGDCIYDFSDPRSNAPGAAGWEWVEQRASVHGDINKPRDLRGENVLISRHFYYFGRNAIAVTHPGLEKMAHPNQGHKCKANDELLPIFVQWIDSLGLEPGQLYGWPDLVIDWTGKARGYGKGYGAPGWAQEERRRARRVQQKG